MEPKVTLMKHSQKSSPEGIALVIVLSFLILISVIILAFFSSVSSELTNSKAVANSASIHQLADSAVNVVMAQIVDATKGQDPNNANATLAWASQPGMIRTFDASGKAKNFYKLYSSDSMVVDGSGFAAAAEVPLPAWHLPVNSELYTDLNVPNADSKGVPVYPIVDPAADGTPASGQTNDIQVEGFSITSPPGYDSGKPPSALNNRAPMPVQWLYVLKDGTLKAATSPSTGTVNVTGATTANPIVGRIAFWADDETAKVNINTASEGTYWDVPRIYSKQDFGEYASSTHGFSMCQPVQHEYQRYPGHPATTCLSTVFGAQALLPVTSPYPNNPQAADAAKLDPYYNIAPRIGLLPGVTDNAGNPRTSRGGSQQVPDVNGSIATDSDRLYASIDELMFTPTLTTAGTPQRIPNTGTNAAPGKITKGVLEKAKFFITANSTAPETTLNNTPRVAVWPVSTATNQRTAYDSLLAFCSTIGGKEYYFSRTPITGARSSTADFPAGGRNFQLYSYLQALTKADVPGFGGNFLKKYPAGSFIGASGVTDRDQILTDICDYIRCTNLQDQSTGATSYTPLFSNGQQLGAGEVIPIKINNTQGFGRFYSVTSANLLFYGTHKDSKGNVDKMRAVFFLGFVTPMQGLACMRSNVKYKVTKGALGTGLADFQANGKTLSFKYDATKGNGTNYMDTSDLNLYHGRSVGGTESPWQAIKDKPFSDGNGTTVPSDAGGDASGKYPFFSSQDVDVPAAATDFTFKGAPLDVEIRTADGGNKGPGDLIQTVHLVFPDGQFKKPGFAGNGTFGSRTGGSYDSLVNPLDTVVALQVGGWDMTANAANPPDGVTDSTAGDTRMTASLPDVPSTRFRPDKAYATAKIQFAHCLVQSVGEPFNGATYGMLAAVPSPPYKQNNSIARQPDVPSRASAGVTRAPASGSGPGDWDTGFGDQKDGAYINKPDEGDTALTDNTNGRTRLPYMLGFGKGFSSATNTYFSPNREIPSPLMFGSISTGVQRMLPWQTLLFHPRPEDTSHPGNKDAPKDHLLADLFWMPVVEPYAISQPFATNGKINLNYQIMPFTYINRSTGLQAVMKSTKFAALALSDSQVYKPLDATGNGTSPTAPDRRLPIDMTATLKAFETKFSGADNSKNTFRSASQICEMNLVPPGETDASMAAFWKTPKYPFTGDNLREKPYVDLYSRLTTKSNTFTVHVRVQALKKAPGSAADKWDATKDKVVGEYRGSSILERYIDVNDPALPDFATKFASNPADATLNIDQYYKMRVVSTKRFAP